MVFVDIRLQILIICFQHKLKKMPITKQTRFILGIEDVQVFGELKMLLPKLSENKCKSKLNSTNENVHKSMLFILCLL
jgi:hypothetical protein